MNRCIQLAKNGLGNTYPNPMVGCVLVREDEIIGEGWHHRAGLPHAEVVAIQSVTDTTLLPEATLYVNLEPCSHHGKTPPCSDLIISSNIPKVVIGCTDPNPLVAGKGIEKLRAAGVEVIVGILQKECESLNKRFFTYHTKKRPYIFLKWAETKDGFMAPTEKYKNEPVWITNTLSRQWVHKLRAQEQAILIGGKTLVDDNPSLTTRNWQGRNPLRLIVTERTIPENFISMMNNAETVIFSSSPGNTKENLTYQPIDFMKSVPQQICQYLFEREIQSLIVEGGCKTLQSFIDEDLWDEAFVFVGDTHFGDGLTSPKFHGNRLGQLNFKEDRMWTYKNMES